MSVSADGQQRVVNPRRTKYVWRWVPTNGGESKTFTSESEARDWVKEGNPGSLMVEPAV